MITFASLLEFPLFSFGLLFPVYGTEDGFVSHLVRERLDIYLHSLEVVWGEEGY